MVIGVFFERYYLVIPGAAYPQHYYSPGKIEGVWGGLHSFALTPVEMVLSIGIIALLVLLFVLGLKYLELLPAKEPVKEKAEEPTEEKPEEPTEEKAEEPAEEKPEEPAEGSEEETELTEGPTDENEEDRGT